MTTTTTQQQPPSIQWGKITLLLDNDEFRESFSFGRRMYFDGVEYDSPEIAERITTQHIADAMLREDKKHGGYRFDRMAFPTPFEVLGAFLGYMSGPLIPETPEEREERYKHIVFLPEDSQPIAVPQEV